MPQRELTDDEILRALNTQPAMSDEDILRELDRPVEQISTPQDEAIATLQTQEVNEDLLGVPEGMEEIERSVSGLTTVQPGPEGLRPYIDTLESKGINAKFALDPRWGTKIDAEAQASAQRYLRDTKVGDVSLRDVPGEEAEEARRRVGEAMRIGALVRNSPLVGQTARKVHAAALRNLTQQRLDRVFSQVQRNALGLAAPKAFEAPEQEKMNQIAQAAQVVLQAPDDILFKAGQLAGMIDRTDPMSPTDEVRQQTPNKLIESNPFLRSAFQMITRLQTGGVDAAAGVGEGGTPLSSKRPADVVNALAVVLGAQWPEQVNAAKKAARVQYNLGQLGINPGTGQPGYSPDGALFVDVVAGDALDVLVKGAAAELATNPNTGKVPAVLTDREEDEVARIIKTDAPAEERLAQLKGTKRAKVARELIANEATQLAKRMARLEATGTEMTEQAPTPFENAESLRLANDFAIHLTNLMESTLPYFQDFAGAIKETDVESNRAFEEITGIALDKNFTYALTNSEKLTEANEGFFDAWTASAAMNRLRKEKFGGVKRWLITTRQLAGTTEGVELGKDPVVRGATTPEAANEMLREETDVARAHATDREFAMKKRDETLKRVMTWQRNEANGEEQKQGLMSHWTDMWSMGVHMLADAWYEISRIVHERPEEAVAGALTEMGIGNPAMSAARAAVSRSTRPVRRLMATGTTGQALQRLQYANPSAARRFHSKFQEMHDKAFRAGDNAEMLDALEAAAAAAGRAADEAEATGGIVSNPALRDFGAKTAAVWDELTADPGDIQTFTDHVDAAVRQRTLLQELHDIGREVFGVGPKMRIRDFTSSHPFDPKAFDQALEAFDTITSSGTELETFAVNLERAARDRGMTVNDFSAQNPNLVRELMPEQVNDVIAMVDQAQRIGGLHNDAANRLVEMFGRIRGAKAPDQLAKFRETVTDVVNQISLRATDMHLQKLGWHHASKRIARATDQLRRRAEAEMGAARETLRRATRDATDEAGVERAQLAFDGRRKELNERFRAILDFERRVREHDPDVGFDARDVGVLRRLSDNDIEMLVTEAPELWGVTPDDLFIYRVRGKGTRRQVDAINSRISNLERALADADPEDVPAIRERLERARADAVVLKNGRRERAGVRRDVFFELMAHDGLGELAQIRKDGLTSVRNTIAAQQLAGVGSNPFMPAHLPLRKALKWSNQAMRAVQGAVESRTMRLQQYMDVYRRATPDEQQFMDEIMQRVKGDGLTMEQANDMLSDIITKYPKLRSVFDDPRRPGQLRDFALEQDRNMGSLYGLMEAKGVDKGIVKFWREKGYDPNFYGVFERRKLVQGVHATKLFQGREGTQKLTQPVATSTGESLKFQRQVNDWRVLVQEPGGGVIEESFPRNRANRKPAALHDWIRERYGKKLRFEEDVPGVEVATTPTGDTVRVGKPLIDELNVLDPIGGHAGARGLVGMYRAYKDIGQQLAFETLNTHGTVVLDPDDFFEFQRRHGNRNASYVLVPDNPDLFGAIAGKYVHRKAIADVNAAGRVFDHVNEFLSGARQALDEAGVAQSELIEVFGKVPGFAGRFVQSLTAFMKQNLILLNERVWLGNPLFNVITDAASGAGVYTTSEGFGALMWARRQLLSDVGRLNQSGITRLDPIREEFIQAGLGGGFFEGGGPSPAKELFAKITGFEELDQVRNKLAERQNLERRLRSRDDRQNVVRLQREISALELQERRLSENVMKKLGRNLAAAVFDNRGLFEGVASDVLGRRGGRFVHDQWNALRGAYNAIDDMHKLAQYYTLRKFRGANPVEAAQHVRDFSQNYQMVPNFLRPDSSTKQMLLSLVTSFPYEAARIGFNLMHKRPTRTAAIFSVLPMLNMASLTAAGIDKEQYFALMETRGAKSKTDAILHLTNNLIDPGPGGTLATNIDLGIFQAFPNLITNDFSPLPAMLDTMFDTEDSEWWMAAKIPARFLGNFLLNNPIFGGQFAMAGMDIRTGERLWDDTMSAENKVAAAATMAGTSILPPWMYASRSFYEWEESDNLVLNPRTDRPLSGQEQKGTLVTRAAGLATKGRGAAAVASVLRPLVTIPIGVQVNDYEDPGIVDYAKPENVLVSLIRQARDNDPNPGPDLVFPVHSTKNELRKWLLVKAQSDDPAVRAKAQEELENVYTELAKDWAVANDIRSLTDREKFLKEQAIKANTVEASMARLRVDQQVEVLIRMDRLGFFSDRRLADMVQQVQYSKSHRMKTPPDPDRVQRAIDALDQHLESDSANPRLRKLRRWLGAIQPRSEIQWKKEHRRKVLRGG